MLSKVLLILSGNAGTALLTLLRNLLVARLVTVEDYGIAATFALVMTMVEVVSTFGLQQQIIQAKTVAPDWQAALQGFQLLRAVISALVMFVFAGAIAQFLGVPEIAWAYQVLAIAPLMNGVVHLDVFRLNRELKYLPLILTQTVPALVSFLMVWPLWLWFGNWRVMLWAVVAQWVLMAGISIIVSERRYRLRLDRDAIFGVVRFGWPLLVNAVLLFAVMNGEKLIVARELGLEALAIFAMGFTLTLTPTLVMAKSIQSFFLPQLSAVQEEDTRFQPLAQATVEANFFNGALLILGIVLLGGPFVEIVLGEKYAPLIPLLSWLAILQALRVFKAGGAVVSLARAKTENAMIANMFRVVSLPASWWVAVNTGDLLMVIWIASAGEALGVITSLALARFRADLRLAPLVPLFIAMTALVFATMVYASWSSLGLNLPDWVGVLVIAVIFLICLGSMRSTRAYLKTRTLVRHEAG